MTNYHYYVPTRYYLVKYMNPAGVSMTLHKNGKVFFWNTHGNDKKYQTLAAAKRKAKTLRKTATFNGDRGDLIVVEISYEPTNPRNPDGSFTPIQTVVSSN
jgi:hypothetical protein